MQRENPFKASDWVFEIHEKHSAVGFRHSKILLDQQSPFQRVQVFQTRSHGVMLFTDGVVMTSEADEFIYHEMIAHVPLFTHPDPRHVLIIGGGDGGAAREVLKHPSVEKCVMAEIDPLVASASRKYLPFTAKGLNHPRLKILFQDGADFIQNQTNVFDVILIDSGDPVGPAKKLFTKKFYKSLFAALKEDGLLAAQGESPFYNLKFQKNLLSNAGGLFKTAGFYHYANMTYPCGLWSFLFASKKYHPLKAAPSVPSSMSLRYYNAEMHRAAFARPEFLKRNGLQKI